MTKEKVVERNFKVLADVISPDNVQVMAELIAIKETKHLIGYMGYHAELAHKKLCCDIHHIGEPKYSVSDSYDLVQTVALFLCEHFGERLDDYLYSTKKGKAITIKMYCYKLITRQLSTKYRRLKSDTSLERLPKEEEPGVTAITEHKQDYTIFDQIVAALNLTENMEMALNCRMAGMSFPEIGRILNRAQSTVFEYFIKMRQRYTAIYGVWYVSDLIYPT